MRSVFVARSALVVLVASFLHAPPVSAARTSCSFGDRTLTFVVRGEGNGIRIFRGSTGQIRFHVLDQVFTREKGRTCGRPAATVRNTDTIRVRTAHGNDDYEWVEFDLSGGPLGPGATSEETGTSEIELRLDFGAPGGEQLVIPGSPGDDVIAAGQRGVALNGDGDADVTFASHDRPVRRGDPMVLSAGGGEGNDVVSAAGGFGTGAPAAWAWPHFSGSLGDDRLLSGPYRADMNGGDGADVLTAQSGDDRLVGGRGGDVIAGGDGNDWTEYADSLHGVEVDLITGVCSGGDAEGDVISGIENVEGTNEQDVISGTDGPNVILGGFGYDRLAGRDGDDVLMGGDLRQHDIPGDRIDGGLGSDWSVYRGPRGVEVNLATGEHKWPEAYADELISIENLSGTPNGDTLIGDGGPNVIEGGAGPDVIDGGGGDDVEMGEEGDDTFDQGAAPNGADEIWGDKPYPADAGDDHVDYTQRRAPFTVTRDDQADDGELGERDNVHSDVESP